MALTLTLKQVKEAVPQCINLRSP